MHRRRPPTTCSGQFRLIGITLIDGSVLVVDPISPRPLPVPDPAKEREKQRRREREIPAEGNIIPGVKTKLEMPGDEKHVDADGLEEDEVKLHLLQGGAKEVVDFKVRRASIKKVEYFEDMLLDECDRLVATHDYTRAFECAFGSRRETRAGRACSIVSTTCSSMRRGQSLDRWRQRARAEALA